MIPLRSKFLRKCVYINIYIKIVKNGEKYVWLLCEYIFHVGSPGGRSVKVTSSGTFSALRPLGVEHPHLFHQQRKRITTKDHNSQQRVEHPQAESRPPTKKKNHKYFLISLLNVFGRRRFDVEEIHPFGRIVV